MSLTREFHTELLTCALRECTEIAAEIRTEYQLPNGKIADIIFRQRNGDVVIVEVKTTLAPEMITQTLRKYEQYAHYVIMAVPEKLFYYQTKPTGILSQFYIARHIGWMTIKDGQAAIVTYGTRRRIAPSLIDLSRHYTKEQV